MLDPDAKLILKQPSPPSHKVESLYHNAMVALSLLSEVAAAHVGTDTAHLKPEGNPPRGSSGAYHRTLARRWAKATNEYDRLVIVRDAQLAVRTMRHAPDRAYIRGTREWKLAVAMDERASIEVAVTYGISSSYVRALRADLQAGKIK